MDTEKLQETFRSKVTLLLIDKLLLAALLVFLAHWLSASLQREGKEVEYQKTIFDRRVEAYLDVLQRAERVTAELALYWVSQESIGWPARLSEMGDRWQRLSNRSSSGGGSSSFSNLDDLLPVLRDLESSWRSKSIYFSAEVSAAVDEFLRTVYADLDHELTEFEQRRRTGATARDEDRAAFKKAAWIRARQASEKLVMEIKSKLKLSGIILG